MLQFQGCDGRCRPAKKTGWTKNMKNATEIFSNWGRNGLGIGVYQDKPMLATEFGIVLLNEYQFEEEMDEWEMEEEIWVLPVEVFVRGLQAAPPPKDSEKPRKGPTGTASHHFPGLKHAAHAITTAPPVASRTSSALRAHSAAALARSCASAEGGTALRLMK